MKAPRIYSGLMVLLLSLLVSCEKEPQIEWKLPVNLNQGKVEVYEKLGIPTEIVDGNKMASMGVGAEWKKANPNRSLEYFYEKGLVVKFLDDSVVRITVQTYHGYPGWRFYMEKIYGDLLPSDDRSTMLKKLGKPTRMTTDQLPVGINLDSGVTMPSESQYTWDKGGFTIEIFVLNQAQRVDSTMVKRQVQLYFAL